MVKKIYRFLQFAPLSLFALSAITTNAPMQTKMVMFVMFGAILLFVTTVILNIIWSVFGLWSHSEA